MSRKVRIEIDPEGEEEVIIRCKRLTPEIEQIRKAAQGSLDPEHDEIMVFQGDREYLIPLPEILFFESTEGKTAVHTKDRMFYSDVRLYELTEKLPRSFMRVSKSCVLHLSAVSSLHRDVTGICEVFFSECNKKVYISRMYYKPFREALSERNHFKTPGEDPVSEKEERK